MKRYLKMLGKKDIPIWQSVRCIVFCGLFPFLAGCASNCGSFISTSSSSLGCSLELAAGILTAPIWMPVYEANEARKEDERKERIAKAERFTQQVKDGNFEAIIECLKGCQQVSELGHDDTLRRLAAEKLLEMDGTTADEKLAAPLLMARVLLMREAYWTRPAKWEVLDAHVLKAYSFIHHPEMPVWVYDIYFVGFDLRDEVIFYRTALALHRMPEEQAKTWLESCPQALLDQSPTTFTYKSATIHICKEAFRSHYRRSVSEALCERWQDTVKSSKQASANEKVKLLFANGNPMVNLSVKLTDAKGKLLWSGTTNDQGEADILKKDLPDNVQIEFEKS